MSTDHDISQLRGHLFDTLAALKDKNAPMDIERARAIADVAQVVINSAKVEVDYLRVTGGQGSGFIPELPAQPTPPGTPRLVRGKAHSGSA